jgi:diguanylate cyclase (GGDEF)-like protein/PAS domain S-box-containing protein
MMLHTRAYAGLILACSVIALLAAVSVTHFLPQYIWLGIGAPTLALAAIVLAIRPRQGDRTLEFIDAFEDAPAGLLLLDLDGRVEWANRSIESMLNRPRDGLIDQPLSALLGDAWDTLQGHRTQLLNGERIDLEGQITTAPDHRVWCKAHAKLLKNHQDRPQHVILQILDLSATRDAQSAVTASEVRLARTLDLTTDLIIKADYNGRIVYANAAANRVLAGSGPLPGRNILQYVTDEDRKTFAEGFKRTQSDGASPARFARLSLNPGGAAVSGSDVHQVSATITRMNDQPPVLAVVCRDTHEQLTSLDQLRSSEARFSRIFHSSPDAILIVRQSDSLILDFNSGFTQLLGYTREQAIGELEPDLELFVVPRERQDVIDSLDQATEITNLETRLKTVNGDPVYVEISLRYIEIDGEFCTLCIGRDITKRKLAEAALRASEEKFEQVFRRSPDGIVILRQSNLTIYEINDSFLDASNYTREELVDQSIYDLQVFDRESSLTDVAEDLARDGFFSNREMVLHTKAGEPVQTLVSGTLIDIDNEPCVLCIAKNVNELRDAEEKLRQSEQRFRGAFENSPVGIVLLDLEGTIFQANNFATKILGFDERPLEGLHISRLIPPEDRSGFKESLNDLLDGQRETIRSERRMVTADKLEVWTNFHLVMQRDTSGQPYYLIAQIADISEMKSSQSRMERMAFYDTLTNLANRRLFYDRLGQAVDHVQRSDHLSALLYLDLDQFKRVNDTLGHEVGDMLLQEIATRLTGCVRQEDTVARLGGDEFTVLLFRITSPSDASLVADKLLKRLRQPLNISGHQLVITTSIGITIAPQDGTDPNSLMKNADLAMYRAKEHGRNIYQFYSEEMNTNAIKRLRTEYELRRALERNEFELYYQPKVCLTTQQVVGVECLIRWHHPERGLLSPFEFIEVAEETGAIVDMGNWIIQEACRTGRTLCEQAGRNVQIAVNISPRQFKDHNLVSTIRRNLRETGLEPATLEIEITETMLMADVEAANQTVHKLHELGVRLAIDDFGTGYSSLNYLKKFPINTVKVDRSFVMDIPDSEDDMAITSAVIAMAHRLNMEVVAEGVETRDQLEFLTSHHCEYAQGFLFSKPLPLSSIRHMIQPNVRLLGSR